MTDTPVPPHTWLGKAWAWLRANPLVLLFLVGVVAGGLLVGSWDRRHPVVKTVVDTTAVDKAVSNYKEQLATQTAVNQELRDALTTAQQQIVQLQTQTTTTIHTVKKPNGEVDTDTTIKKDTQEKKTTDTNTTDVKTADTSTKTDTTDNKEGQKVDESSIHTTTTTTPVNDHDLLLISGSWMPLEFNHGFTFSTSQWNVSVQAHVGTILGQDIYLGPAYQSLPGGVGYFGVAASLGIK